MAKRKLPPSFLKDIKKSKGKKGKGKKKPAFLTKKRGY